MANLDSNIIICDHLPKSGDHLSKSGDHLSKSGDHLSKSGDHLPKTITWDTVKKVEEVLQKTGWRAAYDRPGEDGQCLLAHKTPGSEVAARKNNGVPSWERHSGD